MPGRREYRTPPAAAMVAPAPGRSGPRAELCSGIGDIVWWVVLCVGWSNHGALYRCRQGGEGDTTGHQRGTNNRDHLLLHPLTSRLLRAGLVPARVLWATTPLLRGVINTLNGRYCCRTSGPLPHSLVRWLFFEGVLVDLLQVEGLPYLNADVVPNHQLGQLFTVDEA